MTTLYLICGLPGAGKTTVAKQLEKERKALRLSPDEWIAPLLKDLSDKAELDRLRSPVESIQWEVAKRSLTLGVDVILEWGFWSQRERAQYRSYAKALGADVEVIVLMVERDELWRRLSRRNTNPPFGTFIVTEDELNAWWKSYEPAAPDEFTLDRNGSLSMMNKQ